MELELTKESIERLRRLTRLPYYIQQDVSEKSPCRPIPDEDLHWLFGMILKAYGQSKLILL